MTDIRQLAFDSIVDRAGLLRNKCLQALKDAALTADEVAERIGETVLSVRPRITELSQAGQVAKTTLRRPNASGRSAAVWVLT